MYKAFSHLLKITKQLCNVYYTRRMLFNKNCASHSCNKLGPRPNFNGKVASPVVQQLAYKTGDQEIRDSNPTAARKILGDGKICN